MDARDELRALLPRLDAAIAAGDVGLLLEVRELAAKHADSLRIALKQPGRRKPPRNVDSWRSCGLWAISRQGGGQVLALTILQAGRLELHDANLPKPCFRQHSVPQAKGKGRDYKHFNRIENHRCMIRSG
jgi:hypothetical protein